MKDAEKVFVFEIDNVQSNLLMYRVAKFRQGGRVGMTLMCMSMTA